MDDPNLGEAMGKRLDLSQLSEEECEQILKVIQKDFELRQKDKSRIEKAEAELQEEKTKESILLRQKDFNDDFCLRCCSRFIFLINSKQQCNVCHYNVCKDCCTQDKVTKTLTCSLCAKQLAFEKENGEWFYSSVKNRFKHFGSAKVVRTLYKQKAESDAEYESASETGSPSGKKSRSDKLSLSQTDSKVLAVQGAIEPTINAESSKLQLYLTAIASTVQRLYVDSDKTDEIQQQRKLLVSSMDDFKSSLWRAASKSDTLSTMTPADKDLAIEVLLSQEVAKFLALEDNILLDDSRSHPEQLADEIVKAAIADKKGSKSSYSGPAEQAVAGENVLEDSPFADSTEAENEATTSDDGNLHGDVAAALVLQEAAHQHRDEHKEVAKEHHKHPHLSGDEGHAGSNVHTKQPRLSDGISDEDADFFEAEIEPKAEVTVEEMHSASLAFSVGHSNAPVEDYNQVHGENSPIRHGKEGQSDDGDISHHHHYPPQHLSVSDEETVPKVMLEIDDNLGSVTDNDEEFVMVDKHLDSVTVASLAAVLDDETEIIEDRTREGSPEPVHVSYHEHVIHKDGAVSPTTENVASEVHHDILLESLSDHINYSEHDDFAIYYVVATDRDADGTVNVELGPTEVTTPSTDNVIDELPAAAAAHEIVDDHVNNNELGDLAEYDIIAASRERDRSPTHHRPSADVHEEIDGREELVFPNEASVAHHEHPSSSRESNVELLREGDGDEQEVHLDMTPISVEERTYEHAPQLQFDKHSPHSAYDSIDGVPDNEESPSKGSAMLATFPSLDDTHQSVGEREGFDESLYDNIPADEVSKKSGTAYDNTLYHLGTSEDNAYELHEHNCNTPELQLESDFKSRDTDIDKVSLTTNEGIYEDLMDIVRTHDDDSEYGTRHLPSPADNGILTGVSRPTSKDIFLSETNDEFKDHTYENVPPQVEIIVGLPSGAGHHADDVHVVEITEIEGKVQIPATLKSELAEHHAVLPAALELETHAGHGANVDALDEKYTTELVLLPKSTTKKLHTKEDKALQGVDIEINNSLTPKNVEADALLSSTLRDELMELEELQSRNETTMKDSWRAEADSDSPHTPPSTPADDLDLAWNGVGHRDVPRNTETFTTQVFTSPPQSHVLPASSDGKIKPGDEMTLVIRPFAQDHFEDELPHSPAPHVTHSSHQFSHFESTSAVRIDKEKITVAPADADLKVASSGSLRDDDSAVVITELYEMEEKVFQPSNQSEPVSAALFTDEKIRDLEERLKNVGDELRSIGDRQDDNGRIIKSIVDPPSGHVNIEIGAEKDMNGAEFVTEVYEMEGKVLIPAREDGVDGRVVICTADVLLVDDTAVRKGAGDKPSVEELPGWSTNRFVESSELEGKLLVSQNVYSEQAVAETLLLDVDKINGKLSVEEQDALFVKIERAHSDSVPSPNDDTDDGKLDDKHWKTIESEQSISELWRIVETVRSDYWSASQSKADLSAGEFSPRSLLSDEEADELFEQIERGFTDSEADISYQRPTTGDNDGEGKNKVVDVQIKEIYSMPSVKYEQRATIPISDNLVAEEEIDPKNGYGDSFGNGAVANIDSDEGELVEIVQIRQVHREVVHSMPVWPGFESTQPHTKPEERVKISHNDLDEHNDLSDKEKLQHESYSDDEVVVDELHAQMAKVSHDESSSDENEIVDVQINQTHRQAPASILAWPGHEPVQSQCSKPTVRLESEFALNSDHGVNNQSRLATKPVPFSAQNDSNIFVDEPFIRKQANIREIVLPELADYDEETGPLENGHSLDDDADLRDDRTQPPYIGVSLPLYAEGGRKDADLDDFTNNNVDKNTSTDDITFKSRFRKDIFHEISPYDNFSVRKVGTNDRPVYMLIPTTEHGVKIGNKDADDISELDENEIRSDLSDGSETGDSDEAGRWRSGSKHKKQKTVRKTKSLTTDSACQTDDLNLSGNVSAGYSADVSLLAADNEIPVLAEAPADDKLLHSVTNRPVRTRHEEDDDTNESFADPRFIVRPADVAVAEGELATFTCEIAGTAPADVFWYRDTDELKSLESDDRVQLANSGGGQMHQLELFNVSKSDTGDYLCIAVSAVGKRTKRFYLHVTDNDGEKRTPQILRPLANVEAVCGEDITFTCKVSAYPQPLVRWYKDGKRIQPSNRIHARKIGNRDYELTLREVTFNDDAEYMIVVSNIAGVTKSNAQLTVSEADLLPQVAMRENVEIQALPAPAPVIVVTPAPVTLTQAPAPVTPTQAHVPVTPTQAPVPVTPTQAPAPVTPAQAPAPVTPTRAPASATSADSELYPAVEKLMEIANMGTELHIKDKVSPPKASKVRHQSKDDDTAVLKKSSKPRDQRPKSEGFSWLPLPRDETPSPDKIEVHTEEDEVELKVSYADYARLYDSGLITYSQLRRGRVRQSDVLLIQAFLNHSSNGHVVQGPLSPQQQRLPSASQGQLVLDLPVAETAAVERSPKRPDKHMFDRDFIVDDSRSRSKRPHSVSTSPVKPVTHVDVQQLTPVQPQQHIITCNIQDTIHFQLPGNADTPASQEVINVKSPFPDAAGLAEVDVKNLRYKWERLTSNDDSDPSPDGKRMRTQQTIRSTLQQVRAQQQPKPVSTSSLHINVRDNNDRRVLSSSSAAQVYSTPEASRYHSLPNVNNAPVNSLQQPQPHLDIKIKPPANKVHQLAPAQFRNSQSVTPRNDGYRSMPDDHRQLSLPQYNGSSKKDDLYRSGQQPVMQLHRQPTEDTVSAPSPNVKELRMKFGNDAQNGHKPRRKGRRLRRKYVASERLHLQITHISSDSDTNVHNLTARSFAASNNRSQNSAFPGQSREFDSRRLPRS